MTALKTKYRLASRLTHIVYGALIACFCLWQLTRPDGPSVFFWLVQTLPLLIFLPGLLARHYRTYSWMCFVLLMYFVKGVDGVISPSVAWIDYVVLSASVVLFIAAMFTSRYRQAYLLQNQRESSP